MEDKSIQQLAWEDTMIRKYGDLDEAKRVMSERGKRSKGVKKETTLSRDPERAKELGRLGALKRWNKDGNI